MMTDVFPKEAWLALVCALLAPFLGPALVWTWIASGGPCNAGINLLIAVAISGAIGGLAAIYLGRRSRSKSKRGRWMTWIATVIGVIELLPGFWFLCLLFFH